MGKPSERKERSVQLIRRAVGINLFSQNGKLRTFAMSRGPLYIVVRALISFRRIFRLSDAENQPIRKLLSSEDHLLQEAPLFHSRHSD